MKSSTMRNAMLAIGLGWLVFPLWAAAGPLIEPPSLAPRVAAGELPAIEKRVPTNPSIVGPSEGLVEPGRHGGTLRMLMSGAKDTRMMTVYGYARLVAYNEKLELVPDILERVEVEGDRVFTLHLRPGHRWSDGHPFTAEDFRYFWDDICHNEALAPMGMPAGLVIDGEAPKFEVLGPTAVRYRWSRANPYFLPALAQASPLYIYRPAHYLKTFHSRYGDPAKLEEKARQAGQRNWAAVHNRMDNQYRNDNPRLPSLDPWVIATKPPAERFVFQRNPYYHRIDTAGQQLPYIDQVILSLADGKLIPAKTGAGESDLQARYLRFDNYTFLRQSAKRQDMTVHLWRTGYGAQLALYPNLNVEDETWRRVFRDARFRRALSLAINRKEVNQVIYYGLAQGGGNTLLPESPLYHPVNRETWARFDMKKAAALLDEMGLQRGRDGIRLLPDGRPLAIIVETAGESSEQTDMLELIHDSWLRAGVKLYIKPMQREVLRNRIFAGQTLMTVWTGVENGLATWAMSPEEFAPTTQQQLQWPKWGQYFETRGNAGQAPDLAEARELLRLFYAWRDNDDRVDRERIWHEMLNLYADQVFSIGIVGGVLQPVMVSNRLKGVPEKGIYNWNPGAHFGIYRPDRFWFQDATH